MEDRRQRQLDVLALEPFHGGARAESLRGLARHTRHRLVIKTLPARQPARRLAVSGTWFAESLALHPPRTQPPGPLPEGERPDRIEFDVVLGGDLLNVADLRRRWPRLARVPVVLRHFGPPPADTRSRTARLRSLRLATQIWCVSDAARAEVVAEAAAGRYLLPDAPPDETLERRLRVCPPAVGSPAAPPVSAAQRPRRAIAIDNTRRLPDAVAATLRRLATRGEKIELTLIGHAGGLPEEARERVVETFASPETPGVAAALARCRSFIGGWARPDAGGADALTVAALRAGCWTLLPDTPANRAVLAPFYHSSWLHKMEPHRLHAWLVTALHQGMPAGGRQQQEAILAAFDPAHATARADALLVEAVRTGVVAPVAQVRASG